ncbi:MULTISPECIES: hypothetical protein [unclassified Bradyrhizobium]|jgi:hypothetical protein|uniref:hypothetical protein n=1 Tax=unclassified Bradyrhizobium TaxID=2631580 RepID=UPI001051397C|nr:MULTISPECIES: hypothetical protein [unclassified Bradyrhizobium]
MSGIARSLFGGRAMCGVAAAVVNRRRGGELASACAGIAWRAKFGKWRQAAKGRPGRPKQAARMRAGTEISRRISSNPAAHLRRGGLNIGRKGQADDRPQLSFAAIDSISETS